MKLPRGGGGGGGGGGGNVAYAGRHAVEGVETIFRKISYEKSLKKSFLKSETESKLRPVVGLII